MPRILLVEDNEENRTMLTYRLTRKGFEVAVAVNGAEGIEMAQQGPDVILMDMSMPVLNGWEATKRLKADPATAGIPVIALTAHAMVGDREQALQAGCDDYLTKPIDLNLLLGKIQQYLAQKAAS